MELVVFNILELCPSAQEGTGKPLTSGCLWRSPCLPLASFLPCGMGVASMRCNVSSKSAPHDLRGGRASCPKAPQQVRKHLVSPGCSHRLSRWCGLSAGGGPGCEPAATPQPARRPWKWFVRNGLKRVSRKGESTHVHFSAHVDVLFFQRSPLICVLTTIRG